jgi:hypothetical protein
MLKKSPKSNVKTKRLIDKISSLNKLFRKNHPKNTSENYNEMVSNFHQKIKNG